MLDISKMLVVAVYTLVLSIISYRYNNTYYSSDSLITLLEKEDNPVPNFPHTMPVTAIVVDENNTKTNTTHADINTEIGTIINIPQPDETYSKTGEHTEKEKTKMSTMLGDTMKKTEPEQEKIKEEQETIKDNNYEEEEKEKEGLDDEDSYDGVPSELQQENQEDSKRINDNDEEQEKGHKEESRHNEETDDNSYDGVPSDLSTGEPEEPEKRTHNNDSQQDQQNIPQKNINILYSSVNCYNRNATCGHFYCGS